MLITNLNMKMTKTFLLGTALVTIGAANQSVRANNLAAASALASASVHRLVVASPHGLEEFPWLLREPSPRIRTKVRSNAVLSTIQKNRALAASPRTREVFPELARAGWSATDTSSQLPAGMTRLDRVFKNRALAASPRMKEDFPALARGYAAQAAEKSSETAPLE